MDFVWYCLIGICAGWLAGQVMKGGGFGLIVDLIIGIIGAMIGGAVFSALGIAATGKLGALITATVGAILLLFILRLVSRGRP